MRLLHTSDWHLGRTLAGEALLEEQARVLDQLVELAREARPDAVLVAGDLYDRAVPPKEAVSLFDDTLQRLVRGLGIPVVAIAGNHDSPERIGFASGLLAAGGLHLVGPLGPEPARIPFADAHGAVELFALPYADPPVVRHALEVPEARTHHQALAAQLARIRRSPGARAVVVAHAFVAGGEASESEEDLSVGGSSVVDAALFEGFDYVALGHLHRPQRAGSERIRYSGSLLKYSFSEVDQPKGVHLVELGAEGALSVETVPLRPRRDLRIVEGRFDEILALPPTEDYLRVRLLDEEPPLDPMNRLRAAHPHVLELQWPRRERAAGEARALDGAARRLSHKELFQRFVEEVTGHPWSEAQATHYLEVTGRLGSGSGEDAQ